MVYKIFLNVHLRKVPLHGLFKFNDSFYRRGLYVRSRRSFSCTPVSSSSCYVSVIEFHSSLFVDFYKEV